MAAAVVKVFQSVVKLGTGSLCRAEPKAVGVSDRRRLNELRNNSAPATGSLAQTVSARRPIANVATTGSCSWPNFPPSPTAHSTTRSFCTFLETAPFSWAAEFAMSTSTSAPPILTISSELTLDSPKTWTGMSCSFFRSFKRSVQPGNCPVENTINGRPGALSPESARPAVPAWRSIEA